MTPRIVRFLRLLSQDINWFFFFLHIICFTNIACTRKLDVICTQLKKVTKPCHVAPEDWYHVQMCPIFFPDISQIFPRYFPDIIQILSRYYPDITQILPRYYPDITQILPRYYQDISKIFPRYFQDISLLFPRYYPDISKIFPRYYPDIPRWFLVRIIRLFHLLTTNYKPHMIILNSLLKTRFKQMFSVLNQTKENTS